MERQPKHLSVAQTQKHFRPDHSRQCENCQQTPVVPLSGLCGPCHFGTAAAVDGDWWNSAEDDIDEHFADEHM